MSNPTNDQFQALLSEISSKQRRCQELTAELRSTQEAMSHLIAELPNVADRHLSQEALQQHLMAMTQVYFQHKEATTSQATGVKNPFENDVETAAATPQPAHEKSLTQDESAASERNEEEQMAAPDEVEEAEQAPLNETDQSERAVTGADESTNGNSLTSGSQVMGNEGNPQEEGEAHGAEHEAHPTSKEEPSLVEKIGYPQSNQQVAESSSPGMRAILKNIQKGSEKSQPNIR